jgi:hypothetical protein
MMLQPRQREIGKAVTAVFGGERLCNFVADANCQLPAASKVVLESAAPASNPQTKLDLLRFNEI